jgi:hypothetical protein
MRNLPCLGLFVLLQLLGPAAARAADLQPLLASLRAVGPQGAGQREAARAWEEVIRADAAELPEILAAMDGTGPLGANWIATAAQAVADRQLAGAGRLPGAELEKFVLDRRHSPQARRLAFEYLVRADAEAKRRLLAGMLDDPSLELRRDAVAQLTDEATRAAAGEPAKAVPLWERALAAARDPDQVRLLAERLRKAGRPVDLPRHFGFLVRWRLIGPFDNTEGRGFDAAYPPEKEIQPDGSYQGKHGQVKWVDYTATDDWGVIDLNKALGEEKDVAGYAATEFVAAEQRPVELRLTSFDAVKLWLNGRLVDRRKVYHSGSQLDQYVVPVVLQPGRNAILVKVCQNNIAQDWARYWQFQLRACDAQGTAILSADRGQPAKAGEQQR